MNPEFALVASLARLTPTTEHRARALELCDGPLQWDRVEHLAIHHGIAPLFASHALRLGLPDHDPALTILRDLRRRTTAADLRRLDHWLTLMRALEQQGIRAVTLRSFAVAFTVYGGPGRRQVPKLNVLIDPEHRDSALRLLADLGYDRGDAAPCGDETSTTLISAQGGLALHWDAPEVIDTAESLAVPNQVVRVPSRLATFTNLVAHGAAASWEKLGYLVDVAECLAQLSPADGPVWRSHLHAAGLLPALNEATSRIGRLWERQPGDHDLISVAVRRTPDTGLTCVTAVYPSGPESLLGGRGWGLDYYLPSLINIANLGGSIVLFCPPSDVERIEATISPYFRASRVLPYELTRFPYFEDFVAWKRTYLPRLTINNRNEVLCFLKSWWLQHAIVENPFGHEQFYWIDAGLTHHGLFPERIGGVELRVPYPTSHYFPDSPHTIFTPALGEALTRACSPGRVFFCAQPFVNQGRRAAYEHAIAPLADPGASPVHINAHLVGGLFGGQAADLIRVHDRYATVLERLIATRTYTLEEQVFSCVHALHPELFSLHWFDTWQFHAPGERTSRLGAEANSFYKIFTRLLAEHPHRV